jgi:SAM-dependent methyltransferase
MRTSTLHLPTGYRRNLHPVDFDDHAPVTGTCAGWEWQPDVYPYAIDRARDLGATTLIDIGCGAARKLIPFADEFELVGIDRPEIVAQIDAPGMWLTHDLDSLDPLPCDTAGAVLICSDVIEHLLHPDHLVCTLARAMADGAALLVLSTPDRIRTRGGRHLGPSPNRGHVQEWSLRELVAFLADEGLNVTHADHTRSNDHQDALATCLVEVGP